MELPECDVCGVRAIYYQRLRRNDLLSGPAAPQAEGIPVPCVNEFIDVIVHACGGRMTRTHKALFDQPAGGNGYIAWGSPLNRFIYVTQCPEATRILKELRSKVAE